jgi:hypothetical protein
MVGGEPTRRNKDSLMPNKHVRSPFAGFAMLALAFPVCLGAAACGGSTPPADTGGVEVEALSTDNGLKAINGMKVANGLAAGNGLSLTAALSTSEGLANGTGLMATPGGRTTLSYLVRCALPEGHAISKVDDTGSVVTFSGRIGLAPEWETGSCGQFCQRWVSACMLALVNTTGQHYPLWMVAQSAAVGWGLDAKYPLQEGAFFGNIFLSPPSAFFCGGRDFGVQPIPGRIGSMQGPTPYTDIYGTGGLCAAHCTPADTPFAADGVKACAGWNEVINVWHQ